MTDALERLIEAVKAGSYVPFLGMDNDHVCAFEQRDIDLVQQACRDDMNAALFLKGILLPDHDWGRAPGGQMWVQRSPAAPVWSGDGYPPARGLLLAILRAKLAENHPRQETSD
ncbi:hypothetical protein [Paracoccus sp. SY]|uniref:hypothetical protein n=1 Tax=Paracoccus sp. SY TaxID=1330255 RepID=UPI000CD3108A|nr:hypothetical protein [Paracoccus sp. SY]